MSLKNNDISYGSMTRFLHWTTAIIIIGMLAFGFFMGDMPKAYKPTIYMLHKSFGLLVLGLVIIRIIWHICTGKPAYAKALNRMEQILSTAGHHTLYLLMIIMPMTGLFMSIAAKRYPSFFGIFTVNIPGIPQTKYFGGLMNQAHEILAWFFIGLIVLHVGAALHHKIRGNGVFERMAGKK